MASSRACGICGLSFPLRPEFEFCPGCNMRTDIHLTTPLDPEWEERLKEFFAALQLSEEETDRIVGWRFEQLRVMGYGWTDAARLASRHYGPDKIELQAAQAILDRGAPAETAAKILL